ncbi:MAG: hypothetical protein QOE93_1043 [Actinomycetota bacterium]|nr:hypothetical protein [Actinomycetota bacterium]
MSESSTRADTWIDVLRRAHDQLAEVVRGLDPARLATASACSDWDVAQVLGHLGSGAEISMATLEAALAGGDGPGPDVNQPIWDRWNGLDGPAKAAGFLEHGQALVARLEALDGETRAGLRIPMSFLPDPIDVATFVRFRGSEVAFHGWDVRVTFDGSATLFGPAVELMIDHSGDFLGYIGHADALGGRSATIAVETTDPSHQFALVIGDAVGLTGGRPTDPDATLRLPAEAWLRLTYGRLPPDRTPAAVSVDGDGPSLDDLRRVFPGI